MINSKIIIIYLNFNYNRIIINNFDNKIEDCKNIKDFINTKVSESENPIKIDLKCSIINVIAYIYLNIQYYFLIQTYLFKTLNFHKNKEII